jgi:thiamine biosynthesis lipoprotein
MTWIQFSRKAMASEFEICLPVPRYAGAAASALDALDLVETLEAQLSVFRPESEISRINRTAAQQPVEVEPRLFALVEQALAVSAQTAGAYDVTAGPLWEAWGFARREGAVPAPEQLAEARQRVGAQWVELDHQRRTVHFRQPGVQLNLGSIGKGYAVDRCAERLAADGIDEFRIHGGQSSVLARGQWTVGVRDPLRPDRRLGELRLVDQALGTSGAQFQSFRHRGRRYGHILDPRTGWPAEGVLSATVLASTAALADALSTAFYVMGPEASLAFCREHQLAAVLVCPARQGPGEEIHTAGLSPEQWNLGA